MAGATIEVDDREIRAALDRLTRTGADPTPALREVGSYLSEAIRLRFREGVGPDGKPWAPLSPITRAVRAARGAGGAPSYKSGPNKGRYKLGPAMQYANAKPLLDTGRLRNSITYRADRDGVSIGTNVVYAAVQHFGARRGAFGTTSRGAPIPWGNIPARPFLGVSREDSSEIVGILQRAIQGAWSKRG